MGERRAAASRAPASPCSVPTRGDDAAPAARRLRGRGPSSVRFWLKDAGDVNFDVKSIDLKLYCFIFHFYEICRRGKSTETELDRWVPELGGGGLGGLGSDSLKRDRVPLG